MKSIILTIAFVCTFSLFSYSQFQVDLSAGFTHQPTELSLLRNGFYISASPSFALNNKFRFHTIVQYRKEISEIFIDQGSVDLNPELHYDLFKFLTLGTGIYYSQSLNNVTSAQAPDIAPELGPTLAFKFKVKNVFLNLRYSKSVIAQIEDYFQNDAVFRTRDYEGGFFQFGLGYTFGKKVGSE